MVAIVQLKRVNIDIDDISIISALNTPGGDVHEWRNKVQQSLLERVILHSPVNPVENAKHRGERVGIFKASWRTDRRGSSGHRVAFRIENFAPHAIYVEEGRGQSFKRERFSWVQWGGEIRSVRRGTRGYEGRHVLLKDTNRVLLEETGGSYAPIPPYDRG